MNRDTNIFTLDENLVNCVLNCLSNISSVSNIALNLSKNEIKNNIKKGIEESRENEIIKKNNFEIVVNSVISLLGYDKFNIEKTFLPQTCPNCRNDMSFTFNTQYIKINLDEYLGDVFSLKDFFRTIKGQLKCRKCQKYLDSEVIFTLLPEILIIVLGAKSQNKTFNYDYNTSFQYYNKKNNNNIKNCPYTLKSLIVQTEELSFTPFLFRNETEFRNNCQRYADIFSAPTILFYEGPKKPYNEDGEYLENDYIREMPMPAGNNNQKITIYFKFNKYNKELYLDIEPTEKFSNAIIELRRKYDWLRDNLKFYFNGKILDNSKTLAENGIQDNSQINIY